MGTGIFGAIPVRFYFNDDGWSSREENKKKFLEYSSSGFLDFYREEKATEEKKEVTLYTLKPDVLLPSFKDFFFEFCTLIGEDRLPKLCKKFNSDYDAIVAANDLEAFLEHFSYGSHNEYDPFNFPYLGFSYIACSNNLTIYRGSYKAILEEDTTLYHMENLLVAATSHPLAKLVKFVMSL
ncbi:MAG: hypothetical protein LBB79_07110 [Prevotellaceae bacterium]|jgi:hypothetical protein|nr:hypothetical protein [Prevotellaceae bacterium]